MTSSWLRRLRWIAAAPFLLVAVLAVVSVLANLGLTALDRATTPAPGVLVDVEGVKIHVAVAGPAGRPAVVLLSGLGTPSPWLDFAPLVKALAAGARVAVVEYPGYGFSGDTLRPRTTAASVEETRKALAGAGLPPPYRLVAHSFSGLQALDWASRHPEEIAGVVGLDTSLPAQLPYIHGEEDVNLFGAARDFGLVRWVLWADPGQTGAPLAELDPADRDAYRRIAGWSVGSEATFREMRAFPANLKALEGVRFPRRIPVTFVLSSESVLRSFFPAGFWLQAHRDQLAGLDRGRLVVLPGGHYIHHGNAGVIAALVLEGVADGPGR